MRRTAKSMLVLQRRELRSLLNAEMSRFRLAKGCQSSPPNVGGLEAAGAPVEERSASIEVGRVDVRTEGERHVSGLEV